MVATRLYHPRTLHHNNYHLVDYWGTFSADMETRYFFAPRLKKTGLDDSSPSSYRPAWNIPFISKFFERIVNRQLVGCLNEFNSFSDAQSAYRRFHSTETAVFKVFSDIADAVANGKIALLLYYWFNGGFRHRRPRHFTAATSLCYTECMYPVLYVILHVLDI